MCQKKNCRIVSCSCCCQCLCDYSCYDCWEIRYRFDRFERCCSTASVVRHKFVCFPCRRVWKSYTNKYIFMEADKNSTDLSDYVPNICKPDLPKNEKHELRSKYLRSRGLMERHVTFGNNGNSAPKCSKCGQEAQTVGRNFRHCKSEKQWNELEENVKNGTIDLQKDFYDYPREGKCNLINLPKYQARLKNERVICLGT